MQVYYNKGELQSSFNLSRKYSSKTIAANNLTQNMTENRSSQ